MIGVATATLNLDTSVAFLTPVLVHTARAGEGARLPAVRVAAAVQCGLAVPGRLEPHETDRPGPAAPQRRGLPGADVGHGAGRPRGCRRGSRARCRHGPAGTRRPVPAHSQHDQWARAGLGRTARCPAGYLEARWMRRGQAGAVPGITSGGGLDLHGGVCLPRDSQQITSALKIQKSVVAGVDIRRLYGYGFSRSPERQ
jgi:hypothetical protein